ncbi:MAG: DUF2934 domain-containing protein [Gammaproteobacteria bacterium]|nr:DUF2934 domain-containing protein [Gammaproteobacteria bacterium]
MTEHSTIDREKVAASRRVAQATITKAAQRSGADQRRHPVSSEERERLIAMTAYYRAERRGFAPGGELQDWYEAAAEIDRQLGLRSV